MRRGRKPIEDFLDVLMHERMRLDIIAELSQLIFLWKLAEYQQVGNFQERRLFCQFFDRISAIAKDALVAVEESDSTLGGTSVLVSKIQCDSTGLLKKFPNVDSYFIFCALDDG